MHAINTEGGKNGLLQEECKTGVVKATFATLTDEGRKESLPWRKVKTK